MKKVLLGNEAIVQGALKSGVDFVSGYPGCPSAEIGDEFGRIAEKEGVYAEWSINEKVALEASIGASFSGLKSLVNMKSFGANVCSDSLLPLAYTGIKAPMVIIIADDPSCYSSAQSEQDSRGFAYLSHLPMLEPADPQECYDFTILAFEMSEKFKLPVILRTTTRVNHQRAIVQLEERENRTNRNVGQFVKNPHQFCTMPPRVLEMKKELLEKINKIESFSEKSKANKINGKVNSAKIGIITSGVSYLHTISAQNDLGLNLPILKLGFFHPLPKKKIINFVKNFKKVLIAEEVEGYLQKEIAAICKEENIKVEILGKDLLPEIGELNSEIIRDTLAKLTGKKYKIENLKTIVTPKRYPRLCEGCPYWNIFPIIKRIAPENTVFGGDIGCNMIAGLPPHNMQDYLFSMGASMGISHGVKKSTTQKVISIIGDGTFFHAGISGLINTIYNKSNPLIIVCDNRITAMTGHQQNPGTGKNLMGEDVIEIKIEEVARACGVKNVKTLDPINKEEMENTVKEFLEKDDVSVIICKRICAILARRQKQ